MADLKPLGSEKLKGDEKIQRILELTYYKTDDKNLNETKNAELVVESVNCVYGIVKENNDYYVKKGLTEEKLDYIGGMFMKNKNRFPSYAEALKRLELLKGQEELLNEDKKYVLKVNKPKAAPTPAPAVEAPIDTPPIPDVGGAAGEPKMPGGLGNLADMADDLPPEDSGLEPETDAEVEGDDYLKSIQKLTGKLGEKLRDFEADITSEDIKYVVNSVLSALDLEKLEETDKDDILSQFEGEVGDELDGEVGDELDGEVGDDSVPVPELDDSEITEEDPMEKLVDMEFQFDDENTVDDLAEFDSQFNEDNLEFDTEIPVDGQSEIEICQDCKGTGVINGEECGECHGEGTILSTNDTEISVDEPNAKDLDVYDVLGANDDDDDPGYDPIEMGETDEVTSDLPTELYGDEVKDVVSQEIELDELTQTINQSVKETLGKYFE